MVQGQQNHNETIAQASSFIQKLLRKNMSVVKYPICREKRTEKIKQ